MMPREDSLAVLAGKKAAWCYLTDVQACLRLVE